MRRRWGYRRGLVRFRREASDIESFNSKLCDRCLNEHEFLNLASARELIDACRDDYNLNRPQSALDGLTPSESATQTA